MTTPNRLGQRLMVASMPVVIASDQTAIPVSGGGVTDVNIVSSITLPVDLTDETTREVGRVYPGVGATYPISAAALPLPAGAATEATLATRLADATFTGRLPAAAAMADNEANPTLTKIAAYLMALDPAGTWDRMLGNALSGLRTNMERATLVQAASPAANTAATLTLPAAGAGLFHYLTHVFIARHATAALAGGGTLAVTTTNLNGLTWRVGNQASITVAIMQPGVLVDSEYVHPIRSAAANTASTIVLPAPGAAVLWTAWCAYYVGP